MTTRLGVIGVGNMGSALVKGWLRAGLTDLVVWDKSEQAVAALLAAYPASSGGPTSPGSLRSASSLEELVAAADTILVVVKPKDAKEVLGSLGRVAGVEQTVISAMAGLTLEWLRKALGPGPALVRVMPNLAVELGVGAVALAAGPGTAQNRLDEVLGLFGRLGLVEVIPEGLFDAVTAVAGSSPAFFAIAMEGMEDGVVAAGMSRTDARRMVRQAALETVRQLSGDSDSPKELRERLVLAGRLDAGVVAGLEEQGLRLAFRQAVAEAMERSRQMSKA